MYFGNYGTGKLAWAMDFVLDKTIVPKYNLNLGGFVQRRDKVTEKWRRKTMGIDPLGVKKAGLLCGCSRDALGAVCPMAFLTW
jgi:hypothetical protein